MSTVTQRASVEKDVEKIPLLETGDHLDQRTFHELYEQTPPGFRAELIEGIVYVASPTKPRHGRPHNLLNGWLCNYNAATPGTEAFDGTTVLLGEKCEPEPDGLLTIVGGATYEDERGYLVGPPELTAEIASSTASYDLHSRRREYEKFGVQEYLVAVIRQKRIVWFLRENDRFVELSPDADGILRSRVFPGLWLDPQAFLSGNSPKVLAVLQEGLNSPEHAAFVAELQSRGLQKRTP